MSRNRERALLEEIGKRDFWLSILAAALLGVVYYFVSLTNPGQDSGWYILRTFVLDILTNIIPVFFLFSGAYLLLRRVQTIRTEWETEDLMSSISAEVQEIVRNEINTLREEVFTPVQASLMPPSVVTAAPATETEAEPKVRRFYDRSLLISSTRKNRQELDSDFLRWDRCTIMVWVLVPQKGETLRNAPDNRYLLAHEYDQEESNRFALRYSSNDQWQVLVSNNKGESTKLEVNDELDPGWHHFLIAWDRAKPRLVFHIDGGDRGDAQSKLYLPYWPEKLDEKVFVGAWVSPYETSYCDTKLFELWVLNNFYEPTALVVRKHRKLIDDVV